MVIEKLLSTLPVSPFVLIALCVVYGLLSFRINQKKYHHIPGPQPWPIIGNFLDIKPYLTGSSTVQDCFLKWTLRYGSLFKLWIGNKPWILVSDPEYIKEILCGKNFPKDPTYYSPIGTLYGQRFAGGGSAIQTNPHKYDQQKKITTMAYHKKYLPKHCQATLSVAGRWMSSLESETEWFPICDTLDHLSTTCLCKIAFGMDVPFDQNGDQTAVYQMVNTCFDGIKDKLFNPLGCTLHLKKVEKVRRAAKNLREVGENFIRGTYEKIRKGEKFPDAMFSYVLQEIHEAGGSFSLEEIIDEFIVQFVAGTETTSNLMKFLLMEVTKNPHVYERLQEEVDRVMSQTTPETFLNDLNGMNYLEQILQETLRLYPVAVATTRTNYSDQVLGKTLIPAGSTIMVCFHVLHRHPGHFDRPNTFDPDRWAPGQPAPMPFTYLPFSTGMRGCPGKHLARLECKIMIANLFYHYHLECHPDQNYEVATTLASRPKYKFYVKMTNRGKPRTLFEDVDFVSPTER
ncbi:hypothetical protein ACHWQZ_G007514 [Mnemiopsis leidyi]